jgi:hypothetical protein
MKNTRCMRTTHCACRGRRLRLEDLGGRRRNPECTVAMAKRVSSLGKQRRVSSRKRSRVRPPGFPQQRERRGRRDASMRRQPPCATPFGAREHNSRSTRRTAHAADGAQSTPMKPRMHKDQGRESSDWLRRMQSTWTRSERCNRIHHNAAKIHHNAKITRRSEQEGATATPCIIQ